MTLESNFEDYTILVVDDEEDLRDIIADYLEDEGFNVLTAASGSEAFEIVQKQMVHLIVSDINMPDGNGVELLNSIKKDNPEKPVLLFITGFADVTVEEAYDIGAAAIFAKPVDFEKLIEVIKENLSSKEKLWSRKTERVEASISVDLEFENLDNAVSSKALNIGRGGMFIALESSFPNVEETVKFCIKFDNGSLQTLEGTAIVRWVRRSSESGLPKGVGVEFFSLTSEATESLMALINAIKIRTFIPSS